MDADVVVGLALVVSFVSPSKVGAVVVGVVQVVPELVETELVETDVVETEVVPSPTEMSCSFDSPCCSSCAVVGGVRPVAGISNKYPST